jgi:ssDNA-binding Zn-finger/Zn-ribbon topoisomerase 1
MKTVIECPYCDGQARLRKNNREYFYSCEKYKEEFTTTDTITLLQTNRDKLLKK